MNWPSPHPLSLHAPAIPWYLQLLISVTLSYPGPFFVNAVLSVWNSTSFSFPTLLSPCLIVSAPQISLYRKPPLPSKPKIYMPLQNIAISSDQLLNCVWFFATPWTAALQASLTITNSQNLLKLMSIELVIPSNNLILCHPLLLLPSIFPNIRVFSRESVLRIRWPKYYSFSFSISPSNEYSGLISFRTDWFDLLAVQGTLKSLLQHHSSKASILWHSALFMIQLSHPYMTTGKTIFLMIAFSPW